MIHSDLARVAGQEIAKSAPPVAVAGVTLLGLGLQDWVYVTAIAYAVLQIAYLIYRWVREWRTPKAATPIKPTVPPPSGT